MSSADRYDEMAERWWTVPGDAEMKRQLASHMRRVAAEARAEERERCLEEVAVHRRWCLMQGIQSTGEGIALWVACKSTCEAIEKLIQIGQPEKIRALAPDDARGRETR